MIWLLLSLGCGGAGSGVPGGGTSSASGGGDAPSAGGSTGLGGDGGAGGQAGDPYEPDPIPRIDPEPPPTCGAGPFQFLDDTCGDKRVPSHVDRDLTCPSIDESAEIPLLGGGTALYRPSTEPVVVEDVLGDLSPSGLDITVILIRRVGGVPHYRYLSNGTAHDAIQPWSTSKFLAAANAAARLRIASGYEVGLTASVSGIPLGDLVTSIHNYDYSPYSSNSLGRYMHDIGGRARANDMIHGDWLGRPSSESFGGNYGADAPPLGFTFAEPGGASVSITPDGTAGPANHLATFTTAEALKRLVLHREEPDQRLPGIQWDDIRVLLYGAEGSAKYGEWGGMSADTAIYLQTGHDIDYLEARSHGRWRIFSKLGNGSSGQFLNVGYACFPVLDPNEQPVPGWGREMVIAAHLPTGGSSWAERDRILARAYRAIVTRIIEGSL